MGARGALGMAPGAGSARAARGSSLGPSWGTSRPYVRMVRVGGSGSARARSGATPGVAPGASPAQKPCLAK